MGDNLFEKLEEMMYLILYVKHVGNILTIIWFSSHKIEYPRIRSNYQTRDVKMLTCTHILKSCLSMSLDDENKNIVQTNI